jgi:hypothetical protein
MKCKYCGKHSCNGSKKCDYCGNEFIKLSACCRKEAIISSYGTHYNCSLCDKKTNIIPIGYS